jgi:hypothetical protein
LKLFSDINPIIFFDGICFSLEIKIFFSLNPTLQDTWPYSKRGISDPNLELWSPTWPNYNPKVPTFVFYPATPQNIVQYSLIPLSFSLIFPFPIRWKSHKSGSLFHIFPYIRDVCMDCFYFFLWNLISFLNNKDVWFLILIKIFHMIEW